MINPSISDKVNQAILKGVEVKPENRPQSMQEWLSLLGRETDKDNIPPARIPSPPPMVKIVRLFKSHVDYDSPNAGKLIHHRHSWLHYHITISDTHAFNFGANGFAVFPLPRNFHKVRSVKLLDRKEVLDRCLIAYDLFKGWDYGYL